MREFGDDDNDSGMHYTHKRALDGESLAHMHRRMDANREMLGETREMLIEIREMLVQHIALDAEMNPAIKELVTLWRGSKLMGRILVGVSAAIAAVAGVLVWAKEHLK
ncbi:MAG: hypothetical protein MUE63_00200 [Xanthomonadales bacterium]|jgi:hypothetical protein|nr:hypothetical protein [Xanthomonadales bacterium]